MSSVKTSSPRLVSSTSNAELRKIKKPLIERRRRERINQCLMELKGLVLEATNKDESCYSKMEKADILEMTVSHLKSMQLYRKQPNSCSPKIPSREAFSRYAVGFNECAKQVGNFLSKMEDRVDNKFHYSLMKHLEENLQKPASNIAGNRDAVSPAYHNSTSGNVLEYASNLYPADEMFQLRLSEVDQADQNSSRSSSSEFSVQSRNANQYDSFSSPRSDDYRFTLISQSPEGAIHPGHVSKFDHVVMSSDVWRPW